ncbi:MAG TPA: hypothetical protein VFW86_00140, partial [Candidatus Limnocylindrales bacterium]|nr:hypothetical protein [Candidatus Limnocylindrales bacterium]
DIAPDRAADVDLANPRRVVRALERARLLGDRPLPAPRGYPGPSAWLGLRLEPSELADRIEARARAQFAAGLVEEAAELRKRFGAGHRSFGAFGYREALALADGLIDEEAAIAADAARTRAFARRQRTWFRGEPGIAWLAGGGEDEMAGSALETAVEAAERLLETRPVS